MSTKVYVTDYEYATLEPEKRELNKIGAIMIPKQCKTEEDVIRECKDASGLIDQYAPITRKVMESLPDLKVVGRYGVGVNTIDVDAATELGIQVLNVPDYCMDEVSNQAISLMLACHRKLNILNSQVHHNGWDYKIAKPIHRLQGQTLGLLGFGRIPKMVAQKAKAFGLNIIAYDPYVTPEVGLQYNVTILPLKDVLQKADIISVHVPLTKDTENLLNEQTLSWMKPEAIVINTSRGPLIDEKALYHALKDKKLGYAGLDVTVQEPIQKDNPLLTLDNVIITPHVAWYSEEAELELKTKVAQGVADVLSGKNAKYLVNRDVL
ncbi:C-terminal binding protein [Megasphaera elsdenii]|uniref:C-terminal binding protein n=1 Tax=Megasphaera elsdenii TaxID=907 RepID=UPI0009186718|nr:C-terminal binding protein [Megasphaera elsdenii]SHJ83643.1 D-3-phosphoglycerate dehydrogenase [Megasphaera elsdenii]